MVPENLACSICHLNEHKYTCPACGVKTCSINCVRRHKRQTECSGLVDQSKFVPKKILSQDETHINRDYNFLMNVGRQIHVGKGDIKSNAKNVFKRQFSGGNQNKNKRVKGNNADAKETVDTRVECVKKVFLQDPNTMIKRNNTMIIQLPPGMSRASSNKTGYDKKAGSFIWTVEWVIIDDAGNEKDRFISYRLKEHLLLKDAVPMNILSNAVDGEDGSTRNIDKEQLHFYLANVVGIGKTKDSILHLNEANLISDALTNKIVLEYPTIYITFNAETWKNRIIKEEEAYNYADPDSLSESSSSDYSDSSDSSDSDSNSDSESDSDGNSTDNESDSDEAPEESSSKPLKVTFDTESEAPKQIETESNKQEE